MYIHADYVGGNSSGGGARKQVDNTATTASEHTGSH